MEFRHYPVSGEDWQARILAFADKYAQALPDARFLFNSNTQRQLNSLGQFLETNGHTCNFIVFLKPNSQHLVRITGYGVIDNNIQNRIHYNGADKKIIALIHECFETRLDIDSVDLETFVSLLYAREKEATSNQATMATFFEQFRGFARSRDEGLLQLEEKRTEEFLRVEKKRTKELVRMMEESANRYEASLDGLTQHYQKALDDIRTEQKQLQHENEEKLQTHQKALEQEHTQKLTELEQRVKQHEHKVKVDQEALDKRTEELNAVDSKSERRKIRSELKTTINTDLTNAPLSPSTSQKRWGVTIVLGVLFVLEIAAVIWFQYKGAPKPTNDQITPFVYVEYILFYLRQTGLIIAAIATGFYYVKWQDKWSAQHAEREFALKQFQLDMERASWVVEMALEWKQETQNELPEQLSKQLTANLFEPELNTPQPQGTPADHIASALLGSAAKVDLDVHGQKVSLDRKGVQQLQRPAAGYNNPPGQHR